MKVPGPHSLVLMSFEIIFILTNWLEHCFFTNWARFRFYPTKIPPFEREFHAELENEGPGASFFESVFGTMAVVIERKKTSPRGAKTKESF